MEALNHYGSNYGTRVPRDGETGRCRGFAFVEYGSVEASEAALNDMKGMLVLR